jgi:lipopolysaccharide exporter
LNSSFITNTAKLAAATAAAQGISFVLTPIVCRFFSPAAFGGFALFGSISAILSSVGCLRYHQALVLTDDGADAKSIAVACLGILTAWTAVCFSGVWLLRGVISEVLNWPDGRQLLLWAPPFVFITGLLELFDSWLVRSSRFGLKAIQRMCTSTSSGLGNLAFGMHGYSGAPFLVLSTLLASCIGVAAQVIGMFPAKAAFLFRISWGSVPAQLKRYRKFPLFDTWAGLFNVLSINLAPPILALFFSNDVVGQYSRSLVLVQMPVTLIGSAVAPVFYQRATREKRIGNLSPFVSKVFVCLFTVGIFPFILLGIAGHDLFVLFLGVKWGMAGTFSQFVSIWCFLVFVGSPISSLLFVFEKQEINLLINGLIVALRGIALVSGGLLGSPSVAVLLFTVFGAAVWVGLICYLLRLAGAAIHQITAQLRPALLLSGVLATVMLFVRRVGRLDPLTTVALGGAFAGIYELLVFVYQPVLRAHVLEVLISFASRRRAVSA